MVEAPLNNFARRVGWPNGLWFWTSAALIAGFVAFLLNSSIYPKPPQEMLIRSAAAYYAEKRQPDLYSSSDDFLLKNPDCCTVSERGSEGWQPRAWVRLWIGFTGIVTIKATNRSTDPQGALEEHAFWEEYVMDRNGLVAGSANDFY